MPAPYPIGDDIQFLDNLTQPLSPLEVGIYFSAASDTGGNPIINQVVEAAGDPVEVDFSDGTVTIYPIGIKLLETGEVTDPVDPVDHSDDEIGDHVFATGRQYIVPMPPGIINIPSPSAGGGPAAPGLVTIPSPGSGSSPPAPGEIDIPSPSSGGAPPPPGIIEIPSL